MPQPASLSSATPQQASSSARPATPQTPQAEPTQPGPVQPSAAGLRAAEPRPAEGRPAQPRPAEGRPAQPRPAEGRPAQPRPAEGRPAQPRPAEGRPAQPRPAHPEAAQPQAARPETARPETARPETARPETARPETARPETARPETARPESARPEAARPKPVQPEPAQLKATQSESAQPAPTDLKPTEPDKATEHDHDRVDAARFNTQGGGTLYTTRNRVRAATEPDREPTDREPTDREPTDREPTEPDAEPDREPTIVDVLKTVPAEPPPAELTPEVMLLPEPDRNRPTVALDRSAVPGQPPSGLSRLRQDPARADRALQDRVRQERTAALLETSTFWKSEEERRTLPAPPAETPEKPPAVRQRARRRAPEPRRPAPGLFGLLVLGLIATFFAWVSAEPFWLAVGHGDRGSATVARCTGSGVTQRCIGHFTATDGTYRVDRLALFGVDPDQRAPGVSSPARMVSSESRQAYVGSTGVLMHLRWALSFVLVLLCGLGIAALTGVRRLESAPARRGALLVSMAGPLVLLAGFLSFTY